jgi:phosphatidylserine decarboxylase
MSKILENFVKSRISKYLNPLFIRVYKIDISEMETDPSEFKSLHELFTRKLKNGARVVDLTAQSLASPVDGVISSFGKINGKTTFAVKNTELDLTEMLGSQEKALRYQNGHYIIFYLSPRNYHRIHSPIQGNIHSQWTLGGKSYPVNKLGLKYGKKPLSTNFRKVTEVETENGSVAIVKVGALNVNSIHLTHLSNNLMPGDDLAYFSFGSTVVLLIEEETFQFHPSLTEQTEIQYGKQIGTFI